MMRSCRGNSPPNDTKYRVLNRSVGLAVPEKKLLEQVFDLLIEMAPEQEMLKIIGRLLSGLNIGP